MEDRKTVFELESIIARCFEEAKKVGYIKNLQNTEYDYVENQRELIHHISMTVIGELYEFEIIRRIAPIFRENRALSADFLMFGDAFQLFYDKVIQEAKSRGIRIHPEGQ